MWCITKSLFFCHIDLKPLGFGGSQNGTLCAGSPKDSSSHWGSSPHGINHKSRVLPIPLEYYKPPVHMAVWIVSRASSWLYHQNPQLHYFPSAYISFFTICKYKDVLFVWAFLRLHVIHPPGYNRRPMGTGSATEPRSDATRWNSAAWSKRLRPRNRGAQKKRGVDNGFQSTKMGIYIYMFFKYIVI
jgi:hypothetical protein